jgi:sphingolipid delta-4 desaturase
VAVGAGAAQETFSYYGPWNALTYHVGYHNEHHDFPAVPGSRLAAVRAAAPEFYDSLRHHTSYTAVIAAFVFDERVSVKHGLELGETHLRCHSRH